MTNDIIQDIFKAIEKYENKQEILAALKGVEAVVEQQIVAETTVGFQQMFAKNLTEGKDH